MAVFGDSSTLKMKSVDLVSAERKLESVGHHSRVIGSITLLSELHGLEVHDCRFDHKGGVNDESEESFIFEVHNDVCRDVVTIWQLWARIPLVVLNVVSLRPSVLLTSEHHKVLAVGRTAPRHNSGTHSRGSEWCKWFRFLQLAILECHLVTN